MAVRYPAVSLALAYHAAATSNLYVVDKVTGVAHLNSTMYVVCARSSKIWLYDVTDSYCRVLDQVIEVDGMKDPVDIAASIDDRQLYVADKGSGGSPCIWKVSADTKSFEKDTESVEKDAESFETKFFQKDTETFEKDAESFQTKSFQKDTKSFQKDAEFFEKDAEYFETKSFEKWLPSVDDVGGIKTLETVGDIRTLSVTSQHLLVTSRKGLRRYNTSDRSSRVVNLDKAVVKSKLRHSVETINEMIVVSYKAGSHNEVRQSTNRQTHYHTGTGSQFPGFAIPRVCYSQG